MATSPLDRGRPPRDGPLRARPSVRVADDPLGTQLPHPRIWRFSSSDTGLLNFRFERVATASAPGLAGKLTLTSGRVPDDTLAIRKVTAEFRKSPFGFSSIKICITIVSKRPNSPGYRAASQQVLTPVVDHVDIGSIEPVRVRALHGDALHSYYISVGAQAPVGIFASEVHASLYSRSA